jgi:hypothetical protein
VRARRPSAATRASLFRFGVRASASGNYASVRIVPFPSLPFPSPSSSSPGGGNESRVRRSIETARAGFQSHQKAPLRLFPHPAVVTDHSAARRESALIQGQAASRLSSAITALSRRAIYAEGLSRILQGPCGGPRQGINDAGRRLANPRRRSRRVSPERLILADSVPPRRRRRLTGVMMLFSCSSNSAPTQKAPGKEGGGGRAGGRRPPRRLRGRAASHTSLDSLPRLPLQPSAPSRRRRRRPRPPPRIPRRARYRSYPPGRAAPFARAGGRRQSCNPPL